jgi:hypothetical protein
MGEFEMIHMYYEIHPLTRTGVAWVVGYGPFSLCVIHKEVLCPSNGDINGLMMMIIKLTNNRMEMGARREICEWGHCIGQS